MLFFDPLYQLALIVLQSAQAMRSFALLENSAKLMEVGLTAAVIVLGGGIYAVIFARLIGAVVRGVIGIGAYIRLRASKPESLPTVGEILHAARINSPRPYWRFGVLLALDKNVSKLYTLLPIQLVGMWAGETEAGYLGLALGALSYPALLFAGVQTNLESRLPAEVGRQNYVQLKENFNRALRWIGPLAAIIFSVFAAFSPMVVWLLYGEDFYPAIPVIITLSIYGIVTSIGGAFAPLYRGLRLAGKMLLIKLAALVIVTLPALSLLESDGALGGAWAINFVYLVSVGLTIAVVWPRLNELAGKQRE